MIDIFKITKKAETIKTDDKDLFNKYSKISKLSKDELLEKFDTSMDGLSTTESNNRLKKDGPNIVIKKEVRRWYHFLYDAFKDLFILILLFLALINFLLGDVLATIIIIVIAIISALIRFFQDISVYKFNQKLKEKIFSIANIIRDGKEEEIKTEKVVVGDIIKLNAGAIVPADIILLESKDLFINQSVFTGESVPVERNLKSGGEDCFNLSNMCLMGSNVVSGWGTALVINTGFDTYLGKMSENLDVKREPTNFEIGMQNISKLLLFYMIIVSATVFILNGIIRENMIEALFFAISVAVGITPSMLPMIVNVNLTKGSRSLAEKKVLVKNIYAIQNLGSINILCTDKTGTLTMNNIILQIYMGIDGKENIEILDYAYLNSYYSTGIKNLVDRAVVSYGKDHGLDTILNNYKKIDEIPFDYTRKKLSVVVKTNDKDLLICKGAYEEVLKGCTKAKNHNTIVDLDEEVIKNINNYAQELAMKGMQVIGLATKDSYPGIDIFDASYESDMTFVGLVAFLDPPKDDAKEILANLKHIGISTKILTGDSLYATKNICQLVGLRKDNILTGLDVDKMTDEELIKVIDEVDVFARLNPMQKERVVKLYKTNHVVGYMGDGVNDALSLTMADVGISVNTATDIAKEASDIILLEKNLEVIYDGVIEGRKVYGNTIKYMKMALSADFGDVCSVIVASIFLPFLPLLPIQMLLQDFLYDISQIGIPYDNVDKDFLEKPHTWDTKGIKRFMNVMGPVSSLVDILAFAAFWYILGYNTVGQANYFQTAWFVQCLISETLIIHYVRTAKKPFIESCANKKLIILSMITIIGTILTPIILSHIPTFNFVILPLNYYIFTVVFIAIYSIIVEVVKKLYIKKYHEWL